MVITGCDALALRKTEMCGVNDSDRAGRAWEQGPGDLSEEVTHKLCYEW